MALPRPARARGSQTCTSSYWAPGPVQVTEKSEAIGTEAGASSATSVASTRSGIVASALLLSPFQ